MVLLNVCLVSIDGLVSDLWMVVIKCCLFCVSIELGKVGVEIICVISVMVGLCLMGLDSVCRCRFVWLLLVLLLKFVFMLVNVLVIVVLLCVGVLFCVVMFLLSMLVVSEVRFIFVVGL